MPGTIITSSPLPVTRCTCGGYLTVDTSGRLAHADYCPDCPPTGEQCPFGDLHDTCGSPTPVECGHYRCRPGTPTLPEVGNCAQALEHCCGCCAD